MIPFSSPALLPFFFTPWCQRILEISFSWLQTKGLIHPSQMARRLSHDVHSSIGLIYLPVRLSRAISGMCPSTSCTATMPVCVISNSNVPVGYTYYQYSDFLQYISDGREAPVQRDKWGDVIKGLLVVVSISNTIRSTYKQSLTGLGYLPTK